MDRQQRMHQISICSNEGKTVLALMKGPGFDIMLNMNHPIRTSALEKIAFGTGGLPGYPTVGYSYPSPTVSDVLTGIGVAQARGIGTQEQRTDAFGRIINSGLMDKSPAGVALRMIGGGVLGRVLTSAFTKNPFIRGLGTGIGAVAASSRF